MTEHTVRSLRIIDISALNKMYDSLFEESKRLFHPGIMGLGSINFNWILAQLALAASSFTILRKLLLRIYPSSVFLTNVSTNELGEIIGVAYVKIKKSKTKTSYLGELGVCVRDDYHGKNIGSELIASLLKVAKKENVQSIYLTVLIDNLKAIHLYEKYGFKKTRILPKSDFWCGTSFDFVEMCLNL